MADTVPLPISARGAQVIAWVYCTWAIAAIVTSLRIYVRWLVVRVIGKEDACIVFALITALLSGIFMHLQVSEGGHGHHFSELGPGNIIVFLKYSYASILTYNFSLCASKFAILFLCLRVFGPSHWRKACIAVLIFLIIVTVWMIVVSIAPCIPIDSYWDKTKAGWCFPNPILWFMNAGLNIFSDFLVVLLPIPGIFKLQLPRKQKIGVSLVFALGFFICIISIVRLKALYTGATTTDPTYDNYSIGIWSMIEVNGAIVGACLPTLKPLIARFFPRLLSSGRSRPDYTRSRTIGGTYGTKSTRSHAPGGILVETRLDFDTASATEMLGEDGVVLSTIDAKGSKSSVSRDDLADGHDGVMVTERRTSSDGWSGRSSQRPVYEGGHQRDVDVTFGKA